MTINNKLLLYNIQRFSVHDGPGIRTTLFFKGCPLKCWWCHNPESQNMNKSISINTSKCIDCGYCLKVCQNKDHCVLCGKCIDICPTNARVWVGEEYSVSELVEIVEKDKAFYEESGGGVTLSGGEPLMQAKNILPLVKALKSKGYHIALDTSGYGKIEDIKTLTEYIDLWLYDIKHLDKDQHIKLTGVSNEIILSNLEYLDKDDNNIWIRYPYIPSCNTNESNIHSLGSFVKRLKTNKVFILPYHNLAEDKHDRFEYEYKLAGLEEPSEKELEKAKEILESYNLEVFIGG